MMSAMRDRPSAPAADFGACFKAPRTASSISSAASGVTVDRLDHPAQGGVASIARQRGDNSGRDRGIEFGKDVGRRRRSLGHQQRNDRAFGRLRKRLPYVELAGFPELRIENVGDLLGRQSVGEQVLGLSSVAKQIGAHGEARGKFLDDPVQRGRRDGAEPGRRPRHRSQVRIDRIA